MKVAVLGYLKYNDFNSIQNGLSVNYFGNNSNVHSFPLSQIAALGSGATIVVNNTTDVSISHYIVNTPNTTLLQRYGFSISSSKLDLSTSYGSIIETLTVSTSSFNEYSINLQQNAVSNLAVYVASTVLPTKGAVSVYLYVPEVSVANSNYVPKPAPVVVAVPSNLYIAVNDTVIEYNIPTKKITKTFTTPSGNDVSYLLNTSNGLYVGDASAPPSNAYVYLIDSSFSLVATYEIVDGAGVYSMSTYGSDILVASESEVLMLSEDLSTLEYSTSFSATPQAVVGNETDARVYVVTYDSTSDNVFVLSNTLSTVRSALTPDENHGYTLYYSNGTMYVGTNPTGDNGQCHLYAYDTNNDVFTASYILPYSYYEESEFYASNQATGEVTIGSNNYIVDYYYGESLGSTFVGGASLHLLNPSSLSQSTSIGFPISIVPLGSCSGGGAAIQTSPDFPDYLIISAADGVYMVNLITHTTETIYTVSGTKFALIVS